MHRSLLLSFLACFKGLRTWLLLALALFLGAPFHLLLQRILQIHACSLHVASPVKAPSLAPALSLLPEPSAGVVPLPNFVEANLVSAPTNQRSRVQHGVG